MALVLIKLFKKFHIFVKFNNQDLNTITEFVNSAIFTLEKLLYIVFNEVAQLVIGLQHSQETIEVKMHGLECSIGKNCKNSFVYKLMRQQFSWH